MIPLTYTDIVVLTICISCTTSIVCNLIYCKLYK